MECAYGGPRSSTANAKELHIICSFFTLQKKKVVSPGANSRLETQIYQNTSLIVHVKNSNLSIVTAVTLVVVYSLLLFNVFVVLDT